jgi:hypothetical protein
MSCAAGHGRELLGLRGDGFLLDVRENVELAPEFDSC